MAKPLVIVHDYYMRSRLKKIEIYSTQQTRQLSPPSSGLFPINRILIAGAPVCVERLLQNS